MSFASIPVLDLSLADDPTTKPAFLADLRHAIIDIGFLYIKNFGIEQQFLDTVCTVGKEFFDLPNEEKLRIEMKNGPHFLGYSRLGNEITARKTDFREQVDIGTELPIPNDQDPRYRWLYGRCNYNRNTDHRSEHVAERRSVAGISRCDRKVHEPDGWSSRQVPNVGG
jgi:isopenicillin N synthase-like dioxygenase